MSLNIRAALIAAVVIALSGCAAKGSWMGADAEKAYDKELEIKRMSEVLNNDDYYEIHKDGRILVLADAKGYQIWLQTGEIPLGVTKIGGGKKGETLRFELTKREAKIMESKVGFKGGAQSLYEGVTEGLPKGFFGFVRDKAGFHVFDNWNELKAYRQTGKMPTGGDVVKKGQDGATVFYANKSDELKQRFAKLHDLSSLK